MQIIGRQAFLSVLCSLLLPQTSLQLTSREQFMIADHQLQSYLGSAQSLFESGEFEAALTEAELAVDECWKTGASQIAAALPFLSMLRHTTGENESLFRDLQDLPKSLSSDLTSQAKLLHEHARSAASARMLADVNQFVETWIASDNNPDLRVVPDANDDEKVSELMAQIKQLRASGRKSVAVEIALELANEYVHRNEDRKACSLFKQVLVKSKRYGLTKVRIDGLLDFGQFFSRLGKVEEAERVLRLAAGVARKAQDNDRYPHTIAALGVVLAHAGSDSAKHYLTKAKLLLSPWDVETDIVNEHLEAIHEGRPCDCPEMAAVSLPSVIDRK